MTTLIITRGLPGCGKTTWARAWVAENPTGRVRVNRDDIRAMGHDSVFVTPQQGGHGTERAVIAARDALIGALLKRGIDVVCDDTNLPSRTVRDLRRLATLHGADFVVIDETDIDPRTCIDRDNERGKNGGRQVGENVIMDMYARYIAGRPYPLPTAEETEPDTAVMVPYDNRIDHNRHWCVLVDIDGTVALMGARGPYDFDRVAEDQPNSKIIRTARMFYREGFQVVFLSGRSEACREQTEAWLRTHIPFPYAGLFMRASGDMRKDSLVKYELFDTHVRGNWNVHLVLDDRNQVVDMWRSIGLTCLQVADGNF